MSTTSSVSAGLRRQVALQTEQYSASIGEAKAERTEPREVSGIDHLALARALRFDERRSNPESGPIRRSWATFRLPVCPFSDPRNSAYAFR